MRKRKEAIDYNEYAKTGNRDGLLKALTLHVNSHSRRIAIIALFLLINFIIDIFT